MNDIRHFPVVDADARSRAEPGDRRPDPSPAEPGHPAVKAKRD